MEGVVNSFLVTFSLLALASMLASASDPSSLQDFCLTLNGTNHNVFVNGNFCKDPKLVTADDFFSGLDNAGNTSNAVGSRVTTTVNADQILGLDKLVISLVRIDYAPNGGLNPPHTHPRATEVLVVTKGKLYVDFVTSNPDNHLFAKVRRKKCLFFWSVSFISNSISGILTPLPLPVLAAKTQGLQPLVVVSGSNPPINPDVLPKAFRVDKKVVEFLQTQF